MYMRKDLFQQILKSILMSFLISLIGFVAIFSFITGEFPPRLESINRGLDNIKKLSHLSQAILDNEALTEKIMQKSKPQETKKIITTPEPQHHLGIKPEVIANDELLVAELDRINQRRMQLGRKLLTGDSTELVKPSEVTSGRSQVISPNEDLREYLQLSQTQFEILYFEIKALRSETEVLRKLAARKSEKSQK